MHVPPEEPIFRLSLSELFHVCLHLQDSLIQEWFKHSQTPVVLIRLNNIWQGHKGDAFRLSVHEDAF